MWLMFAKNAILSPTSSKWHVTCVPLSAMLVELFLCHHYSFIFQTNHCDPNTNHLLRPHFFQMVLAVVYLVKKQFSTPLNYIHFANVTTLTIKCEWTL